MVCSVCGVKFEWCVACVVCRVLYARCVAFVQCAMCGFSWYIRKGGSGAVERGDGGTVERGDGGVVGWNVMVPDGRQKRALSAGMPLQQRGLGSARLRLQELTGRSDKAFLSRTSSSNSSRGQQ